MKKLFSLPLLLATIICGCNPAADNSQGKTADYFDIKGYFDKEVVRLSKDSLLIKKTVGFDGSLETKAVKIKDWKNELSAFSDAEINRASWRGLFVTSNSNDSDTYISNNDKVPVKEVKVYKNGGKVTGIAIIVKNENILYSSTDSLIYFPDSVYQVRKQQNIRFLSDRNYLIKGMFK